MRTKITLSITAIIVLLIIGALYFYFQEKKAIADIQNFADCKENGFPIQESYPARCMTPDGRTFVEEVQVAPQDPHAHLIQVEFPKPASKVSSPITIRGQARGYWFFEASFPVELVDSQGQKIAEVPAHADSDWMTEEFVPFSITLPYKSSTTQSATLILRKDNPSGLPENEDSISISVTIEANP